MGRKNWGGVGSPGMAPVGFCFAGWFRMVGTASVGFGLARRFRSPRMASAPRPRAVQFGPRRFRKPGPGAFAVRLPGYSISKVRAVSLSTVMRTVTTFSGSSGSIRSGHSTRQRSPE